MFVGIYQQSTAINHSTAFDQLYLPGTIYLIQLKAMAEFSKGNQQEDSQEPEEFTNF